ncbi:hypothetical protein [Albibacterium indicum]|uniref:hypothetical protein n=1 Tax=Albibacterium indicum TaxID=2292082 RepID=UPI000E4F85E7|nr:hypothetical protein [Pedobacter indicus]
MKELRNSEYNNQDFLNDLKLQENPFSVPKNYFTNLSKDILQRKDIIDSTQKTLLTPENYQVELTNDILLKVSEEKLKSKVPRDGFTVPPSYFDNFRASILDEISKEGQIRSLPKPEKLPWARYAAAASIALVVSVVAFFQLSEKEVEPAAAQVENIIDEIPADEIISYLAFYSETSDYIKLSEELEQLEEESDDFKDSFSSEEIESYLENSI